MAKGDRLRLLIAFLSGIICSAGCAALIHYVAAVMRQRRRRAALYASSLWQGRRLRPVIGIAGSGTASHTKLATRLGEWCARSGFHLMVGGGPGVMTSAARAYREAREEEDHLDGLVLAVLPGLPAARASDWALAREEVSSRLLVDQSQGYLQYTVLMPGADQPGERIVAPKGYPNRFVDLAVRTHLPSAGRKGHVALSRNHITVLSSDVFVALPGGSGTASEVELALHYGVPVCLFLGPAGNIDNLSDAAAESAPAYEHFSDVQEFVCNAIASAREQESNKSKNLRSRKASIDDLSNMK
mmetsp:Transcript_608/g.485  ORF Transcript_608/g.485 Transcript_608/m.485 type:complete len:300 (-) Transcript_608:58-957(-)